MDISGTRNRSKHILPMFMLLFVASWTATLFGGYVNALESLVDGNLTSSSDNVDFKFFTDLCHVYYVPTITVCSISTVLLTLVTLAGLLWSTCIKNPDRRACKCSLTSLYKCCLTNLCIWTFDETLVMPFNR